MRSVRAIILKFCGTYDKGWLWFRFCSCGAVGVVFVLFCDWPYVLGVVDMGLLNLKNKFLGRVYQQNILFFVV